MLKDAADSFSQGDLTIESLVDKMVTVAGRDNLVKHVDLSAYGIQMVSVHLRCVYQCCCLHQLAGLSGSSWSLSWCRAGLSIARGHSLPQCTYQTPRDKLRQSAALPNPYFPFRFPPRNHWPWVC